MAVRPDHEFIGKEEECDDCGCTFILKEKNQIREDGGVWVLSICDDCLRPPLNNDGIDRTDTGCNMTDAEMEEASAIINELNAYERNFGLLDQEGPF